VDESVKPRGYEGPIRQLATMGLGRENPTLSLTNHLEETVRNVTSRNVGRISVEDCLCISVNFFHLDGLVCEVRLYVDLVATMTVLANGSYRWLCKQLRGYDTSAPKQLYCSFVETGGVIIITDDAINVRFDKRSHEPILREAELDREPVLMPWLGIRRLMFAFAQTSALWTHVTSFYGP